MASDEFDFDAEMRALGVRKKGKGQRPRRSAVVPSRPRTPTRTAPAPQPKPPARPPSPPRPSSAARPATAARSRSRSTTAQPQRTRPVELVEHELKASQAEVARLQAALAQHKKRQAQLGAALEQQRTDIQHKVDQIDELERDLRTQAAELVALESRPAAPPRPSASATLPELLSRRGILGADEQATVFDGLARQGKLRTFVDQLAPTDAERLTRWLDEHTVLLGDCGDCPGADARAVLRVPRSRCEVCGGSDIRREARRFVDACLNHGTTRVTIVGGSPKYHRQLRELVQHRVLKLRLVPGDARRSLRQARDDLRGSDLVIIWGATVLDHATSAPYTQQRELGRLHTVQQRGITSMLGAVVDHLSSSARPRGR